MAHFDDLPRSPLLSGVVERWRAAAKRFELSPAATIAMETLLAAELDPDSRAEIVGDAATRLTRMHIVSAIAKAHEPRQALAALAELDERRLVRQLSEGDWLADEVAVESRVRTYCLGEGLVKDLRTEHESTNPDAVLDGQLDGFIEAYLLAAAGGTLKKGGVVVDTAGAE